MESTGVAAGLPLIRASKSWGQPYVVSSGDPVGGYFRVVKGPLHGFLFEQYERLLYRCSAGFIGWTPYLAGAALAKGAPRAITVEGAADLDVFMPFEQDVRRQLKASYGLNPDHIVAGVVGSIKWTLRQSYCYGLELTSMLKYVTREDLSVLIVGDGDGRERVRDAIPSPWTDRVVFTGRVPETEVVSALNAMDIGFITQTLDDLGNFRLTTKLPEYLAAGLPVAMSPVPGFYDYAQSAGWALPAAHPASDAFHRSCASWIDSVTHESIDARRQHAPELARRFFSYDVVRPRFTAFINDLLHMERNRAQLVTTSSMSPTQEPHLAASSASARA